MAYLSRHTRYTTFRRQSVLVWFGLVFPSIFLRGSQGEFPGEKHKSNAPWAILRCLAGLWSGLEDDQEARGFWEMEANLYQVLPRAGTGGAQTLNERALTCGGGRWGSAWWCHDMVLAWIKEQESSEWIRQEAFSSGSHTVVDTRFHLALPSRHPPRWEIQRVSEAVCSQIACWNLPAPSDDPAPRRQWLNSASLNANSVESCQWGQAKADLGSPDLLSGEGGL